MVLPSFTPGCLLATGRIIGVVEQEEKSFDFIITIDFDDD